MFDKLLKYTYNYLVKIFLIILNILKIKLQCVYDDPLFLYH